MTAYLSQASLHAFSSSMKTSPKRCGRTGYHILNREALQGDVLSLSSLANLLYRTDIQFAASTFGYELTCREQQCLIFNRKSCFIFLNSFRIKLFNFARTCENKPVLFCFLSPLQMAFIQPYNNNPQSLRGSPLPKITWNVLNINIQIYFHSLKYEKQTG